MYNNKPASGFRSAGLLFQPVNRRGITARTLSLHLSHGAAEKDCSSIFSLCASGALGLKGECFGGLDPLISRGRQSCGFTLRSFGEGFVGEANWFERRGGGAYRSPLNYGAEGFV